MNLIQKWKLNHILNEDEINKIIFELYSGSDKRFIYDAHQKIDMRLYNLYAKFKESNSEQILRFSIEKTHTPFVSLVLFEKPSFILKGEQYNVYIYE